jgi:tetratricopeptide (TPR) repeat protein
MSKKKKKKGSAPAPKSRAPGKTAWIIVILFVAGLASALLLLKQGRSPTVHESETTTEKPYVKRAPGTLTFTADIAPIVYNRCAPCHRPGQSGPFSLLKYSDYTKHLDQIAEVTAKHIMPPWPPEPGYGKFAHERRLTTEELGLLQQWIEEGGKQGDPNREPPLPKWNESWALGTPDLVVTTSKPYHLAPEGKDVYHNFVMPIPLTRNRYVKGVELLPGNARVVHHAFINVDETRQSRREAAHQDPPGFDGMEIPETAITPGGQLLSWQPGKVPEFAVPGLSWKLKTNTDLVLQAHFNPSGKPELVQPSIGFYFTDEPPTNRPFRIKLAALELDIPPGESNYIAEQSYTLPVNVKLTRVGAHAHYLGKDLQGYAILPSGEKKWLLRIKNWNFQSQGDYEYAEPVSLPKGSKICLHFSYDNSTNNPRNPFTPPRRVRYGLQTTDEMGELYFQALAENMDDYYTLGRDSSQKYLETSISFFRYRLKYDPNDVEANIRLGRILMAQGKKEEGAACLSRAVAADPNADQAHYELGVWRLGRNELQQAYEEFQTVVRLNPDDGQAFGNLGYICLRARKYPEAQGFFETALQINPEDEVARRYLMQLKQASR